MLDNPSQLECDDHLVTFGTLNSFEAEQYARLRHNIEQLRLARNLCVIAVTSATANDGKTLTALNLAGALSKRSSSKLLVIDTDFRHPSITRMLGISASSGILQALERPSEPLSAFVRRIRSSGASVLPGVGRCEHPYEVLTSQRFSDLIQRARAEYEFIIIDTPPVIPLPDSTLIRSAVDGYLVVVSANSTPRKLVAEALNLLEPNAVIGLVFNRDTRPLFGYYRGYYRSYFEQYVPSS